MGVLGWGGDWLHAIHHSRDGVVEMSHVITKSKRTDHLMNHSIRYMQGWVDCEMGEQPQRDANSEYELGYGECYENQMCIDNMISGENYEKK